MAFSTVGYQAPSHKEFIDEYLPLMQHMVTFDGQRLVHKARVYTMYDPDDGTAFSEHLLPVLFDCKAPTASHPGDNETNKEIFDSFVKGKGLLDMNFTFNKLPIITQSIAEPKDRPIVLCRSHRVAYEDPEYHELLYIGFESSGYFYPMKPVKLPPLTTRYGLFRCHQGISDGTNELIPIHPSYNHEIKDGIYYSENKWQKFITVFRGGTKLLSIEGGDTQGDVKLVNAYGDYFAPHFYRHIQVYNNGQLESKTHIESSVECLFYTNGKFTLRHDYNINGALISSIEYRGGVRHGRYFYIGKRIETSFIYDMGYLSGPFVIIRNDDATIYKGYFRRDAAIKDPPGWASEYRRQLVGEYTYKGPHSTKSLNFDADGWRSGVQTEDKFPIITCDPIHMAESMPLADYNLANFKLTIKRYYIHGTEYNSRNYYAIINQQIEAIKSATQLLPVLVKMVMEYD